MFWTWESSRLKYRKLSWRDDIPRITHFQKYNFTSVFSDPGNVSAQAFRTSRPRRADGKHPEEKVYGISARRGGDPASSGWTCWVSSTSIAAKQGDHIGQFLKIIGNKFSCKGSPSIWWLLGLVLNILLLFKQFFPNFLVFSGIRPWIDRMEG